MGVQGCLKTFYWSTIAASKCKGNWRQGSPRTIHREKQDSQRKGKGSGQGSRTHSLGVSSSDKVTVNKVLADALIHFYSFISLIHFPEPGEDSLRCGAGGLALLLP